MEKIIEEIANEIKEINSDLIAKYMEELQEAEEQNWSSVMITRKAMLNVICEYFRTIDNMFREKYGVILCYRVGDED